MTTSYRIGGWWISWRTIRKRREVVDGVGTTLECRWLYLYNIVRSQQVHSRRERNLNDGGRRLQHFTTRTIREKKEAQGRGEQSTAEHGKAPFIDPEKATHNTPIPTILIGRQKIAELSKGRGKRRKERGRNEEVGWISYNSTAQHSLTRTKKKK